MNVDERIEEKKSSLLEIYADLPEDLLEVASDLISQAAFMAVTLEDLAALISEEGVTEEYTNGQNQSGRKISSNAKMYSSLIGKYNTIVNGLIKLLPPPPGPAELNRKREKEEREKELQAIQVEQFQKYEELKRREGLFCKALKAGETTQDQYHEFMASID